MPAILLEKAETAPATQQALINLILWDGNIPMDNLDYPYAKAWFEEAIAFTEN